MKKCPYCAEEIQDAAIVCKHCGRDLRQTANISQVKKPAKKPTRGPIPVLVIVFLCLCIFGVISQYGSNKASAVKTPAGPAVTKAPTNTPAPTETRDPNVFYSSDIGTFQFLAEENVKRALRAPATAKFADGIFDQDQWRFGKKGDLVTVQSWVDAQNSFGALIRNQFTAQFSYGNQELLYLELDGEVVFGTAQ